MMRYVCVSAVMAMVMRLGVMDVPGCDAAVPKEEAVALFELYGSTNGSDWKNSTNWLQGDPCDNDWYGVFCDDTNSHIIKL